MIGWLAALSFGQTCDASRWTAPPDAMSVAWVSRLGDRARNTEWLYVVPTADLRAFVAGDGKGDLVRTLQWLGLRRSDKPPTGRYKVVIFDTAPAELCRPVASTEPALAGVVPCDEDHSRPRGAYDGCGALTDLRTGKPSVQVYRGQWQTLAADGFCVLPADRFLSPDR
jgi:hypothetical protein